MNTGTDLQNVNALAPDSQFRPRVLREIVVVPFQNGIVVDGTNRLQIFQGRASRLLLPALIELMDGSRTIQELENGIPGVHGEHVRNAISLMLRSGLLEDGKIAQIAGLKSSHETLSYFRRCSHALRSSFSSEEAFENLQKSEMIIFEPASGEHHTEILKSLLVKAGLDRVLTLHRRSLTDCGTQISRTGSRPLLVSVSVGNEDHGWHTELDDWCSENQLTWLRSSLDNSRDCADLGPLFNRKISPCYQCFASIHCGAECEAPSNTHLRVTEFYFWYGLLASEIIYLASGVGPLATGAEFQRYNLPRWTARSLRWPRIPGCSRCRPFTPSDVDSVKVRSTTASLETAVVFEDYVGLQSLALSVQKEPINPQAYNALALPTNKMSHCNHIKLSGEIPKLERSILDLVGNYPARSNESVKLDELSFILLLTGGIRRMLSTGLPSRWAATAGNLGSVEPFVVAHRVQGLPPGLYRYLPEEHALANFQRHSGTQSTEAFMCAVTPTNKNSLPDVLVFLVGAYGRVAQKYGEFAYRLVNLDSGAAFSQLCLVAEALKLSCHIAAHWSDDLIRDQLNLELAREYCTATISLCGTGYQRSLGCIPGQRDVALADRGRFSRAPREFCEKSVQEVMEMLHFESRLEKTGRCLSPGPISSEFDDNDGNGHPLKILPLPAKGGRLFGDVLSSRKSIREYPPQPVSLEQLGTMLDYAHKADRNQWPTEQMEDLRLTFLVLAFRVEGLEPAVYIYDPLRGQIFRERLLPPGKLLSCLCRVNLPKRHL